MNPKSCDMDEDCCMEYFTVWSISARRTICRIVTCSFPPTNDKKNRVSFNCFLCVGIGEGCMSTTTASNRFPVWFDFHSVGQLEPIFYPPQFIPLYLCCRPLLSSTPPSHSAFHIKAGGFSEIDLSKLAWKRFCGYTTLDPHLHWLLQCQEGVRLEKKEEKFGCRSFNNLMFFLVL